MGSHAISFSNDKGRTVPYYADHCDLNKMFKKAIASGIPLPAPGPQSYFDCTGIGDYQTAMERVNFAKEAFAVLPSAVRDRFRNNPSEMLQFLNDPANREEAIQLGLLAKIDPPTKEGV